MVQRSQSAAKVVQAINHARNKDHTLTIKQAAKELGISESSYYKMRAGTRSGEGSIRRRLLVDHTPSGGVGNVVTVQYQSGDRHGSMNIAASDARTELDAFSLGHNPKVKRSIQDRLLREEQANTTGKSYWTRKDIRRIAIKGAHKTRRPTTNPYFIERT